MLNAVWIILGYFLLFFIIATIIKNNSIVDIGWGLGYVIVVWILFFISKEYTITKIIVNILVSLWGLRLFYHILKRNIFKEEDFRYKKWRQDWGKWVVPRALFQIFLLQGFFMFAVGLAVNYVNIYNIEFSWWMLTGIFVWLIGYFFEVVGDRQLRNHIKQKNKNLLTTGLWKYTRHPNYFGESLMWWGLFLIVFIGDTQIYLILSPIVITILLRFVSGVPLLEKRMSKKPGWDEYASKTNAFFPTVRLGKRKDG